MKKLITLLIMMLSLASLTGCEKDDFNVSLEPPLTEEELSMPVPDFLTAEQQLLYRRAFSLFSATSWYSINIDYPDFVPDYKFEPLYQKENGYLISKNGRYTNYDHFEEVIKSIYTEEFWQEQNNRINHLGEPYQRFKNCDGSLCYQETQHDGSYWRNRNFADTFELVSSSDIRIEFYAVGYYSYRYTVGNETPEDRDRRLVDGYEYIEKHPVSMVLTDDGWRVDHFETTDFNEGEYKGTIN